MQIAIDVCIYTRPIVSHSAPLDTRECLSTFRKLSGSIFDTRYDASRAWTRRRHRKFFGHKISVSDFFCQISRLAYRNLLIHFIDTCYLSYLCVVSISNHARSFYLGSAVSNTVAFKTELNVVPGRRNCRSLASTIFAPLHPIIYSDGISLIL